MESFEEQVNGAIRSVGIWNAILTVVLVLTIILAAIGFARSLTAASSAKIVATELKKSVQSPVHTHDILIWCDAINQSRDYQRQYAKATIQRTESDAKTIERALAAPSAHGLTIEQTAFIREYLTSVVALERNVPQVLSLHPYKLSDLPCSKIASRAAATTKTKH